MKKVSLVISLLLLVCAFLVGCGKQASAPGKVVTTDEDAVKQVITAYYQAAFCWNYEEMKACVAEEFPIYDPCEVAKSNYMKATASGFMVESDVDAFLELERTFNQNMGKAILYQDWNISVSGDTATAKLTMLPAGVDFEQIQAQSGDVEYRDLLFTQVCQMDEQTAKKTLSPEEFSTAHLKVQEMEYQLWLENLSSEGQGVLIQLKKSDGCWLISNIGPAQ
ncbi:MAG: hypothetical protein E7413_04185 [Ruminococcaceae bacterium]|nr:hypothetical protein [Oscillospiraceae bacterium]